MSLAARQGSGRKYSKYTVLDESLVQLNKVAPMLVVTESF
jgi:hypothetical protein